MAEALEIKVTRDSCLQAVETACGNPMKGGHIKLGAHTALAILEFLKLPGDAEVAINTANIQQYRPKPGSVVSHATGGKKK